jgi:hypothetical protein
VLFKKLGEAFFALDGSIIGGNESLKQNITLTKKHNFKELLNYWRID